METKQCIKCQRELSLDNFYVRKPEKPTFSTLLTGECKECRRARASKHYVENIARHKELVKRRYDVHGRFARYGMRLEDYDAMLDRQGGKCALCSAEKPGGKGKWHIDHVGGTNRNVRLQCQADAVRGLLCHRCNVSLGHYEKLLHRVGKDAMLTYLHLKE